MCYLSGLKPEGRQPILDELERRFQAEKKGMLPVCDELSFLHALCEQMKRGQFRAHLGVKARDARAQRSKTDGSAPTITPAQRPSEMDKVPRKRMAAYQAEMAEMRVRLGVRAVIEDQGVTGES